MGRGGATRRAEAESRPLTSAYVLFFSGGIYDSLGDWPNALSLAEAQAVVAETEHRTWEAELYRLAGELLLKAEGGKLTDEPPEVMAEACFQQAIAIARRQAARSWELRAVMSLARLWQARGKKEEAHQILAQIYAWFTEGFDTADLKEARALLTELSCG